MPATVSDTQVLVTITPGAEFDVVRPGVKRNPKMCVDRVEVEVSNGQPAAITLRGLAYKTDGTLGFAAAQASVWPLEHEASDDTEVWVDWVIMPSGVQHVIREVFEKFDQ